MCGYSRHLYCAIRIQLDRGHYTLDIEQYIRYTGQHHSRSDRNDTYLYIQYG
jgi:hypothetical protein